ncbi:hypothetical protein B0H16DRAFT_1527399 [Mycena metata]|uniref:Uncharacterized protein n=1 Tax=Mycena metata TaxID=1033252 RepID=A0AAD7NJT0_9AGAR|nr:hypothetical protein B0H16DRAFT_1527399 [Mycena metata]
MPAFAFAYGSFGDILATTQLIIKVVGLLRSGSRSVECAETEEELKSLSADLANLKSIPVDYALQSSPVALSVAARVQEEVRRCHLLILRFFERSNASGTLLHRILWVASQDRELAAFRMRVIERRTALGVVVGMMSSGILLAVQGRIDQVGTGNSQIRDAVQEGMSSLAQQLATYQQQIVAVMLHVPHGVTEEMFVVASPANAQDWYFLGCGYMAGKQYHKAYEAYQKAVYSDGRNPTLWNSIGHLYFQINQYRDALDAYARAIRINPHIAQVWFDLGNLYDVSDQNSDAIDAYARASEIDPDNTAFSQRLSALLRNRQAEELKQVGWPEVEQPDDDEEEVKEEEPEQGGWPEVEQPEW